MPGVGSLGGTVGGAVGSIVPGAGTVIGSLAGGTIEKLIGMFGAAGTRIKNARKWWKDRKTPSGSIPNLVYISMNEAEFLTAAHPERISEYLATVGRRLEGKTTIDEVNAQWNYLNTQALVPSAKPIGNQLARRMVDNRLRQLQGEDVVLSEPSGGGGVIGGEPSQAGFKLDAKTILIGLLVLAVVIGIAKAKG